MAQASIGYPILPAIPTHTQNIWTRAARTASLPASPLFPRASQPDPLSIFVPSASNLRRRPALAGSSASPSFPPPPPERTPGVAAEDRFFAPKGLRGRGRVRAGETETPRSEGTAPSLSRPRLVFPACILGNVVFPHLSPLS